MSATPTVSDHLAAADRVVAAARDAVASTTAAAQAAQRHRDELAGATGTGPALADRAYRAFADAVGVDRSRDEDVLQGAYPLVESADQTYAALLAAANAAAAAAAQAQAHREKLGS